jgi:hypothetical protein
MTKLKLSSRKNNWSWAGGDDDDEDEDEDEAEDDQGEEKEESAMPGESGDPALPNGDEGSGSMGMDNFW